MQIGCYLDDESLLPHLRLWLSSLHEVMPNSAITVVASTKIHLDLLLPYHIHHILRFDAHHDIPYVNKMKAASLFEHTIPAHEPYLWCDIEMWFFQPIEWQRLSYPLHINAVDRINIGCRVPGELNAFWSTLLFLVGLDPLRYQHHPVVTTVDQETIYPYFNAGCVVVRENRQLFQTTLTTLSHLMVHPQIVPYLDDSIHRLFFHQVVFTLVCIQRYAWDEIHPLLEGMNVPLHMVPSNPSLFDVSTLLCGRVDAPLSLVHPRILDALTPHQRGLYEQALHP